MLIGPDGCSVRTVKLLTVNKFKWLSLEVIFLQIVKIFIKWKLHIADKSNKIVSLDGKLFGKLNPSGQFLHSEIDHFV